MRAVRPLLLLPLFLIAAGSPGVGPPRQGKEAGRVTKIAATPPTFEARLEDGSVVRLQLAQGHVRIVTSYGALKVPVGDVTLIEFRSRRVEDVDKKIAAALRRLKQETLAERARGRKELLALAPESYHALLRAAKSSDLDIVEQAKLLVKQLEEKYAREELDRKPYDVVHTPRFTIPGQVEDGALKVTTTYFGEHSLKLAAFKSLRALSPNATTFVIDAGRYARPKESLWLETTVQVPLGARLRVQATGEIDLWPTKGYTAGPDGTPSWTNNGRPAGALIGRIGATGAELLLGSGYNGTPEGQGKLYLRIVPGPWSVASRGAYRVTIWTE